MTIIAGAFTSDQVEVLIGVSDGDTLPAKGFMRVKPGMSGEPDESKVTSVRARGFFAATCIKL